MAGLARRLGALVDRLAGRSVCGGGAGGPPERHRETGDREHDETSDHHEDLLDSGPTVTR